MPFQYTHVCILSVMCTIAEMPLNLLVNTYETLTSLILLRLLTSSHKLNLNVVARVAYRTPKKDRKSVV